MQITSRLDVDTMLGDKNLWDVDTFKNFFHFSSSNQNMGAMAFYNEEFATEFLKFLVSDEGKSFHYSPPLSKLSSSIRSRIKQKYNKPSAIFCTLGTLLNESLSIPYLFSELTSISEEALNVGFSVVLQTASKDAAYDLFYDYFNRFYNTQPISEENILKLIEIYKGKPKDIILKTPPEVALRILTVEDLEVSALENHGPSSYDAFKILCKSNNVNIKKWLNVDSIGFFQNSVNIFLKECKQELTESNWELIFKRFQQLQDEGYGREVINFFDYPCIPSYELILKSNHSYFNVDNFVKRYSLKQAHDLPGASESFYIDYNMNSRYSTEEEILECPKFFSPRRMAKGYTTPYVSRETFKKLNSIHGLRQKYPEEIMNFLNITKTYIVACDSFALEDLKYIASKTNPSNEDLYDVFLYSSKRNDETIRTLEWFVSPQGSFVV